MSASRATADYLTERHVGESRHLERLSVVGEVEVLVAVLVLARQQRAHAAEHANIALEHRNTRMCGARLVLM